MQVVIEPNLTRWYRWGWISLVGGCVLIAGTVIAVWEAVAMAIGRGPVDTVQRVLFISRAAVTSTLLAAWAGWFVLRSRRRLEALRETLREKEAALAARTWRAEQTAGLAALTRILAHEIRNPLNGMGLHCTILRRAAANLEGEAGVQVRNTTELLLGETRRLEQLVNDYLVYGQQSDIVLHREPSSLSALTHEVVRVMEEALAERGVRVEIRNGACPASVDPARIKQVIHNLLRNAMEATPRGGRIAVLVADDTPEYVRMAVTDEGPGFEDPDKVFRPFYTTKAGGSGLGLAIVRDIVRAHGGEVVASNVPRGGACVSLRVPRES
jgi:signal transduction histidine kinase